MSEQNAPFMTLGKHLKYVREQSHESLAEVSGAVEIDEQRLARIEAGLERPAEEILLLLISHFGVHEREAMKLWELAEYESEIPDQLKPDADMQLNGKNTVMLLALDMRAMYSDGLEIVANKAGLTLTFTQAASGGQASPVARVGVSYDQAEQIVRMMQQAIIEGRYNHGTKLLPPSTEN